MAMRRNLGILELEPANSVPVSKSLVPEVGCRTEPPEVKQKKYFGSDAWRATKAQGTTILSVARQADFDPVLVVLLAF